MVGTDVTRNKWFQWEVIALLGQWHTLPVSDDPADNDRGQQLNF